MLAVAIKRARAQTNTAPTPAQIEAGNYAKGKVRLHGLEIAIENPKGSYRRGVSEDGKPWASRLAWDYGDIKGTVGRDGDNLDVFIGPHPESELAVVINQCNRDGSFDEHKICLGFRSVDEATDGYLANYPSGWKCGPVTVMTVGALKHWISHRDTRRALPAGHWPPIRMVVKARAW